MIWREGIGVEEREKRNEEEKNKQTLSSCL